MNLRYKQTMTREDEYNESVNYINKCPNFIATLVFVETTNRMILYDEKPENLKDKHYMTYVLFYAFGVLTGVPSHFFTTATDYWMYKFRDPKYENYSKENRTELQAEFVSVFSTVSTVSTITFLIITAAFLMRRLSVVQRMIGALCGAIIMFTLTVMFVEINTDTWQRGFFVVTLIIGCLLTGLCTTFMVTLFQLAAKFPGEYLVSILSGQSICGIFASLVQIFALSIGATSKTNGLIYFLVGLLFVVLALLYFLMVLRKSDFFSYYLHKKVETEKPKITKDGFIAIMNKIKYYMISMIIILGSSIVIHPGVTSLVVSMDKGNGNKWNDVFFVPVTTFLFYNLFDYIGREVAVKLKKPGNEIIILVIGICRVAFVPMLMLCNAHPRHHLPVIFDKDFAYIIFIIIFALTHGFLVNLCVIHVTLVTTEEEKITANVALLIFMLVSLSACSFLSPVLVKTL